MKFSLFNQFGALNSTPVFDAFKHGVELNGHTVVYHDMSADVYVIWSVLWKGKMHRNKEIWDYANNNNIPIIVLEVGALKRGITWKVGLNGINSFANFAKPCYNNRHITLGMNLTTWKTTGNYILICCQHSDSQLWNKKENVTYWLTNVINDIRLYTDRNIIIRPHPRDVNWVNSCIHRNLVKLPTKIINTYDSYDFEHALSNAWCVINSSSNPGIQSVINGVPVFTDENSLAYDVANTDYSMIEYPKTPDRTEWFEKICHTEWTIDEIYLGLPLKNLYEKILTTINESRT